MKVNRATTAAAGSILILAGVSGVAMASGGGSPATSTDPASTSVEDTDVNQGPDANPNEPGHQDADETGESGDGETGTEESGAESDSDVNQGPDANPNEPGHQDADETGESGNQE